MKVALYKGTRAGLAGLYNRIVRWWTLGQYSHVELVFSDGMSASSSFADGGVRFKRIEFDAGKWDFIDLPDNAEALALRWYRLHEGKAYDYWANIRFMFGFLPDSKDKYQCAESVMSALGYSDAWRFEPNSVASVLRNVGR